MGGFAAACACATSQSAPPAHRQSTTIRAFIASSFSKNPGSAAHREARDHRDQQGSVTRYEGWRNLREAAERVQHQSSAEPHDNSAAEPAQPPAAHRNSRTKQCWRPQLPKPEESRYRASGSDSRSSPPARNRGRPASWPGSTAAERLLGKPTRAARPITPLQPQVLTPLFCRHASFSSGLNSGSIRASRPAVTHITPLC